MAKALVIDLTPGRWCSANLRAYCWRGKAGVAVIFVHGWSGVPFLAWESLPDKVAESKFLEVLIVVECVNDLNLAPIVMLGVAVSMAVSCLCCSLHGMSFCTDQQTVEIWRPFKIQKGRFVCLGSSVLPPLPAVELIIVSMLQHAWICGRFTNHCSFPSGAWQSSPNKSQEHHNWVFAMLCLSSNILPKFYLRYKNIRSWTEGIDQVQRSVNCDRSLP